MGETMESVAVGSEHWGVGIGQETRYCYELNYDGGKAMRGETKWVGMDS